ncbi:putative aryl hydrocarbon receptor nuclear translocator-like [Sesbania bispinosa]|nr:putative aryl hydrocarbon receptor nuclear translocator-like [Sesbania bispinosa]
MDCTRRAGKRMDEQLAGNCRDDAGNNKDSVGRTERCRMESWELEQRQIEERRREKECVFHMQKVRDRRK